MSTLLATASPVGSPPLYNPLDIPQPQLRLRTHPFDHLRGRRFRPCRVAQDAGETGAVVHRLERASPDDALLSAAIDQAIGSKPKGHDFIIDRRHNRPSVSRHMSVTGG